MRLLLVAAVLVVGATGMHLPDKSDPCDRVECRAGRECLVSGGVAQCLCVTECPDHDRPVCGNDGQSYDNHCLLHQHACLVGKPISIDYRGYCKKDIEMAMREFGITTRAPVTTTPAPIITTTPSDQLVVCYGPQRDALRDSIISAWQNNVREQPWYTEGMTYKESLSGHFFSCDVDRDYRLRPDELIDCFNAMPFSSMPEQDQAITRTLCIDALVEDVDNNKDWRLDFQEFTHLLDPLYQPIHHKCSLEGKDYTDGSEVRVECNHCVCATGSWVCATHECPEDASPAVVSPSAPKDDKFGYMDNKYDLDDDDYDDYDNIEDDEELNEIIKKEDAKKEYNWLTPTEKKKLNHLEDNIKKFYNKVNGTKFLGDDIDDEDDLDDYDEEDFSDEDDLDDEEEETESEEEEDDLLDQYDDLLDKSEMVRNKLQSLKEAIRELEQTRATKKRKDQLYQDLDINAIHHEDSSSSHRNNKQDQAVNARKAAMLAKLERDRQRSQTDSDIWDDQWKAKVKKHQHDIMSNHL